MAGTIVQAHSNTSGYVYLNLPRILCQQCAVVNKTVFIVAVIDGKLILKQEDRCFLGK